VSEHARTAAYFIIESIYREVVNFIYWCGARLAEEPAAV